MSYTPPLEAEVTAFKTVALLADLGVYDSSADWDGDVNGYSQVQTEILASHDGTIDIDFCEDAAFTDVVRSLSIPYTASGGYQFFAAPAFANFIRYRFTNNGGVIQTDFYYTTKILTTAIQPQLLTTDAFIASAMVTQLGRSILTGQDENGLFGNVSIVNTSNDAGNYKSLQVVSGARPSQLAGRSTVSVVVDSTASVLEYTVSASKTFYVTDIILTIINRDTGGEGKLIIRDGTTVAGTIVLPLGIVESANSTSGLTAILMTFAEPVSFDTGLFFEENDGQLEWAGNIRGYEE